MRLVRNLAFGLFLIVAGLGLGAEPAAFSECEGWPWNPNAYTSAYCYPEGANDFENAAVEWCTSECGGNAVFVCRVDIFVWSNPCEAYCYCDIPPTS